MCSVLPAVMVLSPALMAVVVCCVSLGGMLLQGTPHVPFVTQAQYPRRITALVWHVSPATMQQLELPSALCVQAAWFHQAAEVVVRRAKQVGSRQVALRSASAVASARCPINNKPHVFPVLLESMLLLVATRACLAPVVQSRIQREAAVLCARQANMPHLGLRCAQHVAEVMYQLPTLVDARLAVQADMQQLVTCNVLLATAVQFQQSMVAFAYSAAMESMPCQATSHALFASQVQYLPF